MIKSHYLYGNTLLKDKANKHNGTVLESERLMLTMHNLRSDGSAERSKCTFEGICLSTPSYNRVNLICNPGN